MSNLTTDSATWLEEQFEYEFCAECGGVAAYRKKYDTQG